MLVCGAGNWTRRLSLRSAGVFHHLGTVNCVRHSLLDLVSKMARVNRSRAYYANGVRGRESRDVFTVPVQEDASFGTTNVGTIVPTRQSQVALLPGYLTKLI